MGICGSNAKILCVRLRGHREWRKPGQLYFIIIIQTHYLHIIKERHLHFKVKAILMDHHVGFSHQHLKKPATKVCWGSIRTVSCKCWLQTYEHTDLRKKPRLFVETWFLVALGACELLEALVAFWAFMSLESGAQLHDTSLGRRGQGHKGQQRPSTLEKNRPKSHHTE